MSRHRKSDGPALVAVGGLIASGKSTVAARIASQLSAELVNADEIRQEFFELGARRAFAPGFSRAVYPELFRKARGVLASGKPVVLDATFRTRRLRAEARALAAEHRGAFRFVECRAGEDRCRERLRERERAQGRQGWCALFDGFLELWEPVDELPESEHVVVDSSRPPDALEAFELDLEAAVARSS
ncbi:MAG: AAA family ATPase [Deltaproteobacteria bacterium]|nr:MAG: AAA family ATPase [Deltaproteobacteria bacterium]